MPQMSDQETTFVFDYEGGKLRVFSTRASVPQGLRKRLGEELWEQCEYKSTSATSHFVTIPLALCRHPSLIVGLKNPDLKQAIGSSPWADPTPVHEQEQEQEHFAHANEDE
jgi:hypothetical protein